MGIKAKFKKIKNKSRRFAVKIKNNKCFKYYYKYDLNDKAAIFTCKNGKDLAGNMLRLMMELHKQMGDGFEIYFATKYRRSVREYVETLLARYDMSYVKLVQYNSVNYFKCLETFKYVFCDSTLPQKYVKREGQIYVNTWHGCPMKMMGNDSKSDRFKIGNVQRNFIYSDYMVFTSEYYRDIMFKAYTIDKLYSGNVLLYGYPRNDIFFNKEKRTEIRKEYGIDDKRVYVYMPTFREASGINQSALQLIQIKDYLKYIDDNLRDDEVFYVKLHVFVAAKLDFEEYKNIREFPRDLEVYEFLNTADCLVSDYSSVMYDFSNSRQKIVRFVYDEQEYYESRGFYEQPVELPFPKVYNAEDLLEEIRKDKEYDDTELLKFYCTYEEGNAAEKVIKKVMNEEPEKQVSDVKSYYVYNESAEPGIITENIDKFIEKYDDAEVYLSFSKQALGRRKKNFDNISQNADGVMGVTVVVDKMLSEMIAYKLFVNFGIYNKAIEKSLDKMYKRENAKIFYGFKFDEYVYYQGRNMNFAEVVAASDKHTIIYVYYNWLFSKKKRLVKRVLGKYDEIVVCDEDMKAYLKDYLGKDYDESKIRVSEFYL